MLLPRCDVVRGIAVGWPEKNVFQPVPLRSDDTTAAAARRGSDATILQRVEPSDAANAVAQPALTKSMPARQRVIFRRTERVFFRAR